MQTLSEWLAYIESLNPAKIDLGLERISKVAEPHGWNQFSIPVVMFAGTNGKGSTLTVLASLLQQFGVRVGCYTSPHLFSFTERICLSGEEVQESVLCDAFAQVQEARGNIELTYFEMTTLAALVVFQHSDLDVVLLEVGLGGRLDAVNCVDADIAVITPIDLDHTDWLGHTIDAIAAEKAGIFRAGQQAIIAGANPPAVLFEKARQLQIDLIHFNQYGVAPLTSMSQAVQGAAQLGEVNWSTTAWTWQGVDANGQSIQLAGLPMSNLPLLSVATALQALQLLAPKLDLSVIDMKSMQAIKSGIEQAKLVGRMTRLPQQPPMSAPMLLDVAHNRQSVSWLAQRLRLWRAGHIDWELGQYQGGAIVALFGVLKDKAIMDMVSEIEEEIDFWVPIPLSIPRAYPVGELVADFSRETLPLLPTRNHLMHWR